MRYVRYQLHFGAMIIKFFVYSEDPFCYNKNFISILFRKIRVPVQGEIGKFLVPVHVKWQLGWCSQYNDIMC
jgi:hypothetical protein